MIFHKINLIKLTHLSPISDKKEEIKVFLSPNLSEKVNNFKN
jgi:hypothetical protein